MFEVQGPAAARAAAGLPGAQLDVPMPDAVQARSHLAALRKSGTYIEIRTKAIRGMRQDFFTDVQVAADFAVEQGASTDVYVGVLPRLEKAGGKQALTPSGRWLWAECDTETAVVRAQDLATPPPLIIRSSVGKGHCYWPLDRDLPIDLIERGNKRLAYHLGADPRATDAARILRVAGTRNHKYGEGQRVSITKWDVGAVNYAPSALVGDLRDPTPPRPIPTQPIHRPSGAGVDTTKARLQDIPARQYVQSLTGREVRHNMVTCPFHGNGNERTPSLHVGGPSETLWHCFGCDEGGDIFTFAGKLMGLDDRKDFRQIKTTLGDKL